MEVHHCEHEVMEQNEASTKAEQAGRNLARSLSEFQAEENTKMVAQIHRKLSRLDYPKKMGKRQTSFRCHQRLLWLS